MTAHITDREKIMGRKSNYEQIRNSLQTGDIVLFSGNSTVSNLIKWFTGSKWSHVGVVISVGQWDIKLLLESTTLSKIKDITSDDYIQGVQLVPLSERIINHEGDIAIRKLVGERTLHTISSIVKFRNEIKNRPYEKSKLELFRSAFGGAFDNTKEDLSSLFCSELSAELYQRAEWLPNDIASNKFIPKSFSTESREIDSKLLRSVRLENEILL
mgnify:CR=1 FL=1